MVNASELHSFITWTSIGSMEISWKTRKICKSPDASKKCCNVCKSCRVKPCKPRFVMHSSAKSRTEARAGKPLKSPVRYWIWMTEASNLFQLSLQPVLATPWRASCDVKKDYLHTSLAGQLGPQSATSNSQRRMFSTHAAVLETAGTRRHVEREPSPHVEREPSPPVSCEHFCLVPFVDSYTSAQGLSS